MGAHTIRIKCSIVQFLFFMAPSLYCSHSSSAGNTMKSQFLSWDMESIKNSYANWSSGKTQKCLEETASWLSFPLSRFCKGRKKQDNYYDLESTYSCESMKIHGNGVNICVFFVHFTDHQSVIYVPCPRSGHPTRASNSVKKRMHKNPILCFKSYFSKNKSRKFNSEEKGKKLEESKCKSIKCLFYCYLFTNPRDLDKKLWVAQCQSHLNITENWWAAATKIPCTTFSGKKKSGQPFSTVNFGVLESFFISAANDITENTVDDLELNGR